MRFERMTVAGVGLIGGSLALAARAAGVVGEIVGLGRGAANLRTALERGIVDRYSHDPAEAARDADLLVLAVPVRACAAVAAECGPALRPGAVVTDVGSVKAHVVAAVEAALAPGPAFVGAHPIAGTEGSGAAAATAELFRGSRCVLTPGARSTPAAVARIRALWEAVGMRVETMLPERHDAVLAWTSHLPHVLAFSAVTAILDKDATLERWGGPSLRDVTRVAASLPETWTDIFLCNAAAVEAAIVGFEGAVAELRAAVAAQDATRVTAILTRAQAARRSWFAAGGGGAP
ncbi:prephenate dehydrogenase/arogenate dehydrogenase family protein [Candidatus Binatia bacterium]|nr:prephenate dehydrogenase/arogenate dehydrogenase family protein [Candidatus Binatia bacterium]